MRSSHLLELSLVKKLIFVAYLRLELKMPEMGIAQDRSAYFQAALVR